MSSMSKNCEKMVLDQEWIKFNDPDFHTWKRYFGDRITFSIVIFSVQPQNPPHIYLWSIWANDLGNISHVQSALYCITKFEVYQDHAFLTYAMLRHVTVNASLTLPFFTVNAHPSSSVATSNQWCWSGVRGNINKLHLIVVMCSILLLHILWSGLQVSQIGFCLTGSISLIFLKAVAW